MAACDECGQWAQPSLAVDAVVVRGEEVLLIRRGKQPWEGMLAFPGGFVDKGEDPEVAVVRELKEECGLDGKVVGLNSMREKILDGHPAIFIVYDIEVEPQQVAKPCSEVSQVMYIDKSDLSALDWISQTMKEIAMNCGTNVSPSIIDYSKSQGHPYLLHLYKGGELIEN